MISIPVRVSEILSSQFNFIKNNYYEKKVEKEFKLDDLPKIHVIMKRKILKLDTPSFGEMAASRIIFTAKVVIEPNDLTVIDAIKEYFRNAGRTYGGDFKNDFHKVKINDQILIDQSK